MSERLRLRINFDLTSPVLVLYGAMVADGYFPIGDLSRLHSFQEALFLVLQSEGFRRVAFYDLKYGLIFFDDESRAAFLATPRAGVGGPVTNEQSTNGSITYQRGMMAGPLGNRRIGQKAAPSAANEGSDLRQSAPTERSSPVSPIRIHDSSALRLVHSALSRLEDIALVIDWNWVKYLSQEVSLFREFEGSLKEWVRTTSRRKKVVFVVDTEEIESLRNMSDQRSSLSTIVGLLDLEKNAGVTYISGPDEDELVCMINHFRLMSDSKLRVDYKRISSLPRLMASVTSIPLKEWFNYFLGCGEIGVDCVRRMSERQPSLATKIRSRISDVPPRERLDQLVGLSGVKQKIRGLEALRRQGLASGTLHMAFLGGPGTGKTTVADLIGEILREIGVLRRGHTVFAKKDDLVGEYVGHTVPKTNRKIDEALDGVLFIDEAHQLAEDGGQQFNKEAIGALVTRMDRDRLRLCVVFAGYSEPIRKMIATDDGLKSRVRTFIDFVDYDERELIEIFRSLVTQSPVTYSDEAMGFAEKVIGAMIQNKNPRNWANAREMRNLAEDVLESYALRRQETPELPPEVRPSDFPNKYIGRLSKNVRIEDVLKEFDGLVGLSAVRHQVEDIAYNLNFRRANGLPLDAGCHMVFMGNSGTGKTTVARIMGRIFHLLGVTVDEDVKETNPSDLAGQVVGEGVEKTRDLVQNNMGHVFFIDEAHGLTEGSLASTYGKDIINQVLVPAMENYRSQMVFILAGYRDEMENFLRANGGLKRRLRHVLVFPDYSANELLEIFLIFASRHKVAVSEEAQHVLKRWFSEIERAPPEHFGNAGDVRNWFDEALSRLARRLARSGDGEKVLLPEDLPKRFQVAADETSPDNPGGASTAQDFMGITLLQTKLVELNEEERISKLNDQIKRAMVLITAQREDGKSEGSGFNVHVAGKILTAAHVIKGGREIKVRFADDLELANRLFDVRIAFLDETADLALLEVLGGDIFDYIELMPREYVPTVSEPVGLLGFPLAQDFASRVTFTGGTLSGHTVLPENVRALRIDAAAYRGSSGGPLIALRYGKAIGVLHGAIEEAPGINFAIDFHEVHDRIGRR